MVHEIENKTEYRPFYAHMLPSTYINMHSHAFSMKCYTLIKKAKFIVIY